MKLSGGQNSFSLNDVKAFIEQLLRHLFNRAIFYLSGTTLRNKDSLVNIQI